MKFAFPLALGLALGAAVAPASAQLAPGGMGSGMSMGGAGGAPAPKAKPRTPDLAPSGLPGVGGSAPLSTGPQLQKNTSGDPTQELFKAINDNDYGAAQDAVSRGANLQAKDQFGETPLDLAIALNRNNITFMLLGSRNEMSAQGGGGTMGAPWTLNNVSSQAGKSSSPHKATPAKTVPHVTIPAGETGTPDPQAGFLGFGVKN
jgi:hypothetical protein